MAAIKSEMPPLHAASAAAPTVAASAEATTTADNSNGNGSDSANIGLNGASDNSNSALNGNGGGIGSNTSTSTTGTNSMSTVNNTISAAADSSDNQPGTPQPQLHQPQLGLSDPQQTAATGAGHHPYSTHHMYTPATTTAAAATLPHMYAGGGIYSAAATNSSNDMQHQQQNYPSYLSSYEQFYQQQQQQQVGNGGASNGSGIDYANAASLYGGNCSNASSSDFKSQSASSGGVRYHPYLQAPTSNGPGSNDPHHASLPLVNSSAAVSTTTSMSPRVVSSTSPTSTSTQLHLGGAGGNPQSPSSASCMSGQQLQCKKCGIMCTNESDLQEHITNVHGASPYGSSSGYSSSPYIKEEQSQPGHSGGSSIAGSNAGSGNPGDILDLDSQKMVYPPMPGSMQSIMGAGGHQMNQPHHQMHHDGLNDPLHSMHNMQQRAMPNWDQASNIGAGGPSSGPLTEGIPNYMQQNDIPNKSSAHANQSPYYSPKQSPYHGGGTVSGAGANIKHEYPMIKAEYADSQNYVDKSFDPTGVGAADMCQQQTNLSQQQSTMMPVSSSPAEFPSTTTGPAQDQQQQYRGFEPPSSSSILPANSLTAKAASWKSNEARRPKTYNCTACNKWFTSSGHLKRHYNTTLHKNAVKSSGQPDPATLPISAHHHPTRDPNSKHNRRNAAGAAAKQQQQPPAPVQPPEPPAAPDFASGGGMAPTVGMGQMSQYSSSPSPTQQAMNNGPIPYGQQPVPSQQNGFQPPPPQQQQQQPTYMPQVQSTTSASPQHANNTTAPQQQQQQQQSNAVLNGHPNGLAGPSAPRTTTPTTPPSSYTRGLLNIPTITTKNEPVEDNHSRRSPTAMAVDMTEEEVEGMSVAETAEALQMQQQHRPLDPLGGLQLKQEILEEPYPLPPYYHPQQYQQMVLEQQQQRLCHNNTPSSTHSNSNYRVQSPHIISHQHYLEPDHQQVQQQQVDSIFSQHLPPVHMQQQANIMEAPYNIIPLGTNMQQQLNSSTQLLPLPQHITNTLTTVNMDSIQQQPHIMLHQPLEEQLEQQQRAQHSMLSNTISMPDTISTMLPLQPSTTSHIIPSYQQQASGLVPLEHTMTYHTIIGSANSSNSNIALSNSTALTNPTTSEYLQLTSFDPYNPNSQSQQSAQVTSQMLTTADGQILQFGLANSSTGSSGQVFGQPFFTLPTRAAVAETYAPQYLPYGAQRSPQEGDLPPTHSLTQIPLSASHQDHEVQSSATATIADMPVEMRAYSPTVTSSTAVAADLTKGERAEAFEEQYEVDEHGAKTKLISSLEKSVPAKKRPRRSTAKSTTNDSKRSRKPITGEAVSAEAAALVTGVALKKAIAFEEEQRSTSPHTTTADVKVDAVGSKTITSFNKNATVIHNLPSNSVMLANGRIMCLECNKEFTKICYLTQHNKCFHSGEYPYRCEKCGKRFQSESVYTTHLGRHKSSDKPHKCDLCPKQFHHKTDLRRHVEAIHTGNKQHVCDICMKSFCRKDHLRKHLETHSRPRIIGKRSAAGGSSAAAKPQSLVTKFVKNESERDARDKSLVINDDASLHSKDEIVEIIRERDITHTEFGAALQPQQQQQHQQILATTLQQQEQVQRSGEFTYMTDQGVYNMLLIRNEDQSSVVCMPKIEKDDDVAADDDVLIEDDDIQEIKSNDNFHLGITNYRRVLNNQEEFILSGA